MRRISLLTAALLGWSALAPSANAAELKKVNFAFNYTVNEAHVAYWVALEKGYYKEKGLDVETQYSKGSGDAVAKVDIGRADIALADAMVVIPGIARGAKVKIIGMVMDKTPLNFFVAKDSPIKTPKDLEGKTIAAPPGDAQRVLFPAFAEVAGVDAKKVEWLNIDPTAKVSALIGKRADAVGTYYTDLPMFEKAMGQGQLRMLRWSDYKFDPYAISIITSNALIEKDPEMLKGFLEASYHGWQDVFADPEDAIRIFKKRVPELDVATTRLALPLILDLLKTARYEQNGIGYIDREKMCKTVSVVNENMELPRKPTCDEVYTSTLLSGTKYKAGK
jgi:NitT/TauT family transport system substrate-binding protein